jgi:hypothetical protein
MQQPVDIMQPQQILAVVVVVVVVVVCFSVFAASRDLFGCVEECSPDAPLQYK